MRSFALALCLAVACPLIAADSNIDARRKQLNDLLSEYWEYTLKQDPVFASTISDKRYNDQLGRESEEAIRQDAAKSQEYLAKFQAISTAGFPTLEKLNQQLQVRDIQRGLGYFDLNLWQMPVSQFGGIHLRFPQLVSVLSFQSVARQLVATIVSHLACL